MAVFILQLLAQSVSCVSIMLQFICVMFSLSMSCMPNQGCPLSGTTNNLHVLCLLLCSVFTFTYAQLCWYSSVMCFNGIFLFLVTANCSFVALGNNLLCKCRGIIFPLLPVSTLYGTIIET